MLNTGPVFIICFTILFAEAQVLSCPVTDDQPGRLASGNVLDFTAVCVSHTVTGSQRLLSQCLQLLFLCIFDFSHMRPTRDTPNSALNRKCRDQESGVARQSLPLPEGEMK